MNLNQDDESSRVKLESSQPLIHAEAAEKLTEAPLDILTRVQVIAYGVGHFLNDLTAAIWFFYLLFYLKNVAPVGDAQESSFYAGFAILMSQVADGVFTPVIRHLSEKYNTRCGKRMPWYYFGFVLVVVSFYFVFHPCPFCEGCGTLSTLYYLFLPVLFSIGWVACNASHTTLVRSMTISKVRRENLMHLKDIFTYIAYLCVFTFGFVLFASLEEEPRKYQILTEGSLIIGALASLFFMINIPEQKLAAACRLIAQEYKNLRKTQMSIPKSMMEPSKYTPDVTPRSMSGGVPDFQSPGKEEGKDMPLPLQGNPSYHWSQWLADPKFYLYGIAYAGARIYCTISAALLLFYIKYVLQLSCTIQANMSPITFAIVPMVVYTCSFGFTMMLKPVYDKIGRKTSYNIATLLAVLMAVAFIFLEPATNYLMYGATVFIGISQSILLNTSVAFITEIIEKTNGKYTFIYGSYNLIEKILNGVVIFLIMILGNVRDTEYVRYCFAVIPCAGGVLAWIAIHIARIGESTQKGKQIGVLSDFEKN